VPEGQNGIRKDALNPRWFVFWDLFMIFNPDDIVQGPRSKLHRVVSVHGESVLLERVEKPRVRIRRNVSDMHKWLKIPQVKTDT
jgi:hypothetical protein